MRRAGRGNEVNSALWAVRLRGFWQAWGRMTHSFGHLMSRFWLGILYFLVLTPFALIARTRESWRGGLRPAEAVKPSPAYARELA